MAHGAEADTQAEKQAGELAWYESHVATLQGLIEAPWGLSNVRIYRAVYHRNGMLYHVKVVIIKPQVVGDMTTHMPLQVNARWTWPGGNAATGNAEYVPDGLDAYELAAILGLGEVSPHTFKWELVKQQESSVLATARYLPHDVHVRKVD